MGPVLWAEAEVLFQIIQESHVVPFPKLYGLPWLAASPGRFRSYAGR
jgi:hypothetical protein